MEFKPITDSFIQGQIYKMDLSKAFDRLRHDLLLLKCKHYGRTDITVDLENRYVGGWKKRCESGSQNQWLENIIKGTPQTPF